VKIPAERIVPVQPINPVRKPHDESDSQKDSSGERLPQPLPTGKKSRAKKTHGKKGENGGEGRIDVQA